MRSSEYRKSRPYTPASRAFQQSLYPRTTDRTWSDQQELIFSWFANAQQIIGHLVVRARAGTGKTTTIIEGVNRATDGSILLCAFNKRIAEELQARLSNPRAEAKTLHSVGFAAVRRYWQGLRIADGQERADDLSEQVCGPRVPDTIKKLVSKLHTKGREINPMARVFEDLIDIAMQFECEPDEQWQGEGYDVEFVVEKALAAMDIAAKVKPVKTGIDFSDMIFLPVRNGWLAATYDLVVVDEAQDMNAAQLAIARGVCRGRICVVGDDRQAIYGFRGADSESLDRLKAELQADELGLTTTYRCGRAIVALAATIVPDFVAGPNNGEGSITSVTFDKLNDRVQVGDFVLSRVNAPLVSLAMQFLKQGKRTRIAGRDIGAGLKKIIHKLMKGAAANSVPAFIEKVTAWEQKEVDRALRGRNAEQRIDLIRDQAEMLTNLAQDAVNVREVENRIDSLFTDDGLGQAGVITCSSVHRSKGLEADRVFVLHSTLRDGAKEEENIKYVAITRAKNELVWVRKVVA
jgi:superfamily I DNA/RNA helicase